MTHYEPREKTPEWERLVAAHNAAARLAEHHDDCGCRGFSCAQENALFGVAYQAMADAGCETTQMRGMYPVAIYRSKVGAPATFNDCVAQWRTIR